MHTIQLANVDIIVWLSERFDEVWIPEVLRIS